jgi:hypothetical protein
MLGRRTVFAIVLAGATAVSGGVAVASTHGSPHKLQPPKLLPVKPSAKPNVHLGRHHCHIGSDASVSSSL